MHTSGLSFCCGALLDYLEITPTQARIQDTLVTQQCYNELELIPGPSQAMGRVIDTYMHCVASATFDEFDSADCLGLTPLQ